MNLRHRLLWGMLAAVLAGSLVVGLASSRFLHDAVQEHYVGRIRAEVALLANLVAESSPDDLQSFAERSAADLGVRVTLIDETGVVLADSAKDPPGVRNMDNHLQRPEVRDARMRA